MKNILTAIALLLTFATAGLAQDVSLRAEYTHIGTPTEEPDNRVRIGSASSIDLSYSLRLAGDLTDDLRGYTQARMMPTVLCVWERDGPVGRPSGCDHGFLWSTLTFGVEYGWLEGGIGIGNMSGASHDFWGAVPMTAPAAEVGVNPTLTVGEFDVGPTCSGQLILPMLVGDGYTVLERAAGVGPEEPLERGGKNFVTASCGISVGVSP